MLQASAAQWKRLEEVKKLQTLRGVSFLTAIGLIAELGDLRRFKNERSMYHDSENAVMLRSTERESMPRELRKLLFNIMIEENCDGACAEVIFQKFHQTAQNNFDKLETGGLQGHVVKYIPDEAVFGSPVLS
ncbi:MAG: transposase [Desulfovibrio sp.]|jgi:hypothetical protein|nr:transposase [Desulfovibrio sp.]